MKLGEPDLETLLRLEGTSAAPSDSPFTINYLSDNLAVIGGAGLLLRKFRSR